MLKYSKIKLNWRIQITVQNPVVFDARPPLNVLAPGISKASVQNPQHFKKTKWPPRKFEHFTASGRSENTFPHILHDLGYILHHCYLYVLFISQPQSTNFEQNLTRSLHFIGLTSEVGGASTPTWVWAIAATQGRKFETSSAKDTWDINERIGQHLRG